MMEELRRILRWLERLTLRLSFAFWRTGDSKAAVRKVVVLEMTRLGDLVAATALLDPLAAAYPGADLELWADEAYEGLFSGDPRVRFRGLPPHGPAFLMEAWRRRGELKEPGLVLVSASPAARNSLLARLSRPREAYGFLFPSPGGLGYDDAQPLQALSGRFSPRSSLSPGRDHLVRRATRILELAQLPWAQACPRLISPAPRRGSLVVMHAGANWAWRRWPLESFRALEAKLKAAGWEVRLLGPEEQLPLAELRHLLASATLFVGNDSGPLHLAASLGTPCLGLFGPNLPERSGPWPLGEGGPHRTLREEVPCAPCAQTVCVQPDDWCMNKLRVAKVLETLEEMTTGRKHA